MEVHALRGIDLSVETGDIFGIIGLSGAGKSTLLRVMNRLESPSSGEVWIGGRNMAILSGDELRTARQDMGMIFQHFNLLSSRSVSGNIAYPLEVQRLSTGEIKDRVSEMLRLVELEDKADAWPSQLSGGQKQRVAIARALAGRPKVLLCDEATSALDPRTTRSILHLLERINSSTGVTIVLITHEMDVVREICRNMVILEDGVVVESGPVKDVFLNPKSRTAKEFLDDLPRTPSQDEELPKIVGSPLVILRFDGDAADMPIVSQAIKTTGVDVNILSGEIDSLRSSRVGNLTVQLSGNREEIEGAMEYFSRNGVSLEVIWNG
ncbi:MAG: ATP-binding cassette domain-containing protein [Dethiosulfovibrio sp.]|nr:ATP-binding cassette domain-containing protein [Dethiosulfovibrio sp.]